MSTIKLLSDALLLKSYEIAVDLELDQEWQNTLLLELKRRKIDSQLTERRTNAEAETRNEA